MRAIFFFRNSVIDPNFTVHVTLRANPMEELYGMRSIDDVKKFGHEEAAEVIDPSNVGANPL